MSDAERWVLRLFNYHPDTSMLPDAARNWAHNVVWAYLLWSPDQARWWEHRTLARLLSRITP